LSWRGTKTAACRWRKPPMADTSLVSAVANLKLVVVDYESGNLRSVAKALEQTGARPVISQEPNELLSADAAVLPGVGAGDAAMKALRKLGLVGPLREFAASGRPFMGVCLGLQLLMDSTDEGNAECLGIVPGRVTLLPPGQKVPHMGWNSVKLSKKHPHLKDIPSGSYFYFVHSYYVRPEDSSLAIGITDYGVRFCSLLARDNIIATQFHPEKSGPMGLKLYRNFVEHAAKVSARR
jgi:glutamine amidotransferase